MWYETLTNTYQAPNKLFDDFVVLYETKKGLRFRCKLINLLMVRSMHETLFRFRTTRFFFQCMSLRHRYQQIIQDRINYFKYMMNFILYGYSLKVKVNIVSSFFKDWIFVRYAMEQL